MKKLLLAMSLTIVILGTTSCNFLSEKNPIKNTSYINPSGTTIKERINTPPNYFRNANTNYGKFIENIKLKPFGSEILLYDGSKKNNQNSFIAILDYDIGSKDLQQCADAAIRIKSEFLYTTKQYNKIAFHLTNGFLLPYEKYRQGYRLKVESNETSLIKNSSFDYSYDLFRSYLNTVFTYAGTLSLERESLPINKNQMQIGDIFIKGGSPGHCIIVIDMCENKQGKKKFLLAQGFMPAQSIHILKNPHSNSPWYDLDELSYPFKTPDFTFETPCLKRML